jgi:hypothetical protein
MAILGHFPSIEDKGMAEEKRSEIPLLAAPPHPQNLQSKDFG